MLLIYIYSATDYFQEIRFTEEADRPVMPGALHSFSCIVNCGSVWADICGMISSPLRASFRHSEYSTVHTFR